LQQIYSGNTIFYQNAREDIFKNILVFFSRTHCYRSIRGRACYLLAKTDSGVQPWLVNSPSWAAVECSSNMLPGLWSGYSTHAAVRTRFQRQSRLALRFNDRAKLEIQHMIHKLTKLKRIMPVNLYRW